MKFSSNFALHSRFHWDFHKNRQFCPEWDLLSECYDKWLSMQQHIEPYDSKIPKIFHQIWLGNTKLPRDLKKLSESWLQYNPDFQYVLWTDSDVAKLPLINREIFTSLANLGARSDILRYEILYSYGGIYIDTDFECIRKLDDKLLAPSFLGCIQYCETPQIGNAILMAERYSPVVRRIIDSCTLPQEESVQNIIDCTGPNMVTKSVFENFTLNPLNILLLPSDYFYPWPSFLRDLKLDPHTFATSNSYGIHHWHTSWIKKPTLFQSSFAKLKRFMRHFFQ